ncbi:restriction endonuclease subunit S [Tenacibaculum finnmarkense]|uniref:restriction endonuclease subunit S n=1 Tax=Tenacibaculum finnmarkense TaxID=2781243 RepID=UPI001E63F761|nr:restriction endonuclease subunit S [Tenacibaculum finnmarkense]MCD8401859.1 restriction endonuclease subunit S [Tenacibaculum finnmarkense genomovar finnmarkense]
MFVKDLFSIKKGKKGIQSDKGIRYIQIGDLRNDDNLKYGLADVKNVLCTKLDVLIAWDGANAGTIGYNLEGILGSTLAKLTPKNNNIDTCYAGRFLQSKFSYLRSNCTGATIPHISRPSLENLKIPLPSLEIQKKIASILDEADKIRQLNKQLIDKYDALTQSLFLEMFGDPVLNPKGWEIFSFKDVIDIRNGKNQKKVLNKKGKYPIYGSGGIMDYADDFISHENSVIIGRKGNINKPILVKEKYWHVDTAFGLNPNLEILDYNYLYFFCKRYNFEQHNKTVTIPSLTKATLLNVKIPIPLLKFQNEFSERVKIIENQKKQAQESLQKSEDLFNSLLQKAFKGALVKE